MEKNLTEKLYEELKKRRLYEEEDDEIEDDEKETEEDDDIEDEDQEETEDSSEHNEQFCEMMCSVLHSRNQAHVFHLQTQSYAEHIALNTYYDGIIPLFDAIIESYQGKYGIIRTFKSFKIEQYKNGKKTISYFERLLDVIEENRDSVEDSFIQNQIDTVQELINSTLYKLRFLK